MSGSRDWRDKGYEFIPFIPKKKEPRITVPQRSMVVDQEAAERRRAIIRRGYGTCHARDGHTEIVLPTQEEFDRVVYDEEDPAMRSFLEGIVRQVLGEEEIEIGDGEKVGPKDSDKKDSTPKNDKEGDGDVVRGGRMKHAAEIQETDEKGSACPVKADAVLNVKKRDGRSLLLEHDAGDPIAVGADIEAKGSSSRPSMVRMETRGSRKDEKSFWTSKWPRHEDWGT